MKTKTIMDSVAAAQLAVEHVESLNRGGCGVFALALAEQLTMAGVPDAQIWGSKDAWWDTEDDIPNARRLGSTDPETWVLDAGENILHHVFVTFTAPDGVKYMVDANTFAPDDGMTVPSFDGAIRNKEPFTFEEMTFLVNAPDLWDDCFEYGNCGRGRHLVDEAVAKAFA